MVGPEQLCCFGHVIDHMTRSKASVYMSIMGYIESIMTRTRKHNSVILRA